MADFEINFPEDFLGNLLNADVDKICREALCEAAPLLEKNMKQILKNDNHEMSGELIASIKAKKPIKAKNGAWLVHVRPTGYSSVKSYTVKGKAGKTRNYAVSNALKAIWIEYGVNGRQQARPFMQRTVNMTESEALNKMQSVYERKIV